MEKAPCGRTTTIVLSSCPSREGDLPKNPEVGHAFPHPCAVAQVKQLWTYAAAKQSRAFQTKGKLISPFQTVVPKDSFWAENWHPVIGALEKEPDASCKRLPPSWVSKEEEREGRRKDQEVEGPTNNEKVTLTVAFGGGDICLFTTNIFNQMEFHIQSLFICLLH